MSTSEEDSLNPKAELLAQNIDDIREHSEAVADDLVPFIQTVERLETYEKAHLTTEVPEDYRWITNIDLDVLEWSFVGAKVLESLGGQIVLVGEDGDRDRKIVDNSRQVAQYAQGPSSNIMFGIILDDDRPALFELLTKIEAINPQTYFLDSENRWSWKQNRRMASLRETDLLERAFMTNVLLGVVSKLRRPDSYTRPSTYNSMELYQQLAENHLRPLGPEEIYGMMSSLLTRYMDQHPEFDVRPPKATDEFDFDL